ncbi:MAG TPA: HAD-IB family hydrolase [Aldersonia sp.]
MQVDEAIARVRSGPGGPSVGAFFDFDGTLIAGYSAVLLYEDLILARKVGVGQMVNLALSELRGRESEAEFEEFMTAGMQVVRGHTEAELDEIGERLFRRRMAGLFYPQAWQLLGAHRAADHTIVIASSASRFQIEAAARELDIEHVLYSKLEVRDGLLTGGVDGKPLWGTGKANAVREFAAEHDIDLDRSYAYGNGGEDVAYLASVGNPVALNPGKELTGAAEERGWPIMRFRGRGRIPGATQIARSALGATGFVTGAAAGFARGALGGSRRAAVDGMTNTASELTLIGAGIGVELVGAEHTRAPRPAVYIFNHQSVLDPVIVGKVLGAGFTGLVSREMAKNPVLGPILQLGEASFLEDSEATASLGHVVETVRSGRSIIVTPEGTRSLTPRLGAFEKGAFHIARQAEVPIVPIVIRNAGEVYWRNSILVRPGTVQVAVLAPIDVSAWDFENLGTHIEQVREQFADTLLNWPTD